MTFEEYTKAARRTQRDDLMIDEKLQHALYGMASEVGEIHALFQKRLQGHPLEASRVIEEYGDLMWFMVELADVMGFSMEEAAIHNNDKLWRRFPAGFDSVRSINREEYK